eukprot:TRINITY_DN22045_c0_g1_i2.p3 TRINITY_DN22045_c0_g1~~TRINITY_DN22045_c0_g1_i2.p3  ORF type:complete len:126 (-),score=38.54 TRINITY_DN22045_c0_g1_i2:95-472(-)
MQRGLVGSEMCIRDRAHAVVQVLTAVQSIFKDILPCIDSYDELEKLIHKIIDLTPIEILKKLMLNMMDNARKIYKDILAFLAALKENDFYKFGYNVCLLYTSDAADDTPCVDLGGRRIIKKKKVV